jgi:porphobilinogen synthase
MMETSAHSVHRLPSEGPDGVNPSRARRVVRRLYAQPALTAADVMAPLLVVPGIAGPGLPGTTTLSGVGPLVRRWAASGIKGLKLFAFGHDRDGAGTGALANGNRMESALTEVKSAAPQIAVTTEVCGCSWTDHGQCVLRRTDGRIDLKGTWEFMAAMAVRHAAAGADVVSPTAMLDGSVRAVRNALDQAGYPDVSVNPNLALHTVLYGPFKQVMDTEPAAGDRRGLQLEPTRAERDALIQARRWITEGADALTLQPVMTAIDVLVRLRADQPVPLIAYSTSGEWAALERLGTSGMVEYHAAIKRAGADLVLTFAAEHLAAHLEGGRG